MSETIGILFSNIIQRLPDMKKRTHAKIFVFLLLVIRLEFCLFSTAGHAGQRETLILFNFSSSMEEEVGFERRGDIARNSRAELTVFDNYRGKTWRPLIPLKPDLLNSVRRLSFPQCREFLNKLKTRS